MDNNFPKSTGFPIGDWPGNQKSEAPPVKLILGSDGAWKNPHRPAPTEAQVNAQRLEQKLQKDFMAGLLKSSKRR